MNYLGKIFVFAVFVMSLVLMTFAAAIFLSHTNWQAEIERKPEECVAGQRPGYKHLLTEAERDKGVLRDEIDKLTRQVGESEQARDQVVAKLQSALAQKSEDLEKLRQEKVERDAKIVSQLEDLKKVTDELAKASEQVDALRTQVREQQATVDVQVGKSVGLAADLEETKATLAVAVERRAQLEKQVANARLLLQQYGLTIDALPKDRVPALDGDVIAVAEGMIEVSLGADDGLQVGHTLEVYRSGEYLGRAVVRAVKADHAIAELVKGFSRGIVQRGDKVTTKLKA
jgi:septal ring factor EnvC (AmiA/AmiB activator)